MHRPGQLLAIAGLTPCGAIAVNPSLASASAGPSSTRTQATSVGAYGPIAFPTRSEGLLAAVMNLGQSKVLRTTDGGRRWRAVATVAGAIEAFAFASSADGWLRTSLPCAGPNCPTALYGTSDGGLTWRRERQPARQIDAMAFATRRVGYVETRGGAGCTATSCGVTRLWRTVDGGRTWRRLAVPHLDLSIDGLAASGPNVVLVAGVRCGPKGVGCTDVLVRSGDGGRSWSTVLAPPDTPHPSGRGFQVSLRGRMAWAEAPVNPTARGGIGALYRSANAGHTWTRMAGAVGWRGRGRSTGTGFESAPVGLGTGRAFAAVQAGTGATEGSAALSVDGGRTWERVDLRPGREVLGAAWDGRHAIWLSGSETRKGQPSAYLLRVTIAARGTVRTRRVDPLSARPPQGA